MKKALARNILKVYEKIIKHTSDGLAMIFLVLIYLISICVTSDMTYTTDSAPYQYADFPLVHILLLSLFFYCGGCYINKLKIQVTEKLVNKIHIIMTIISLVMIILFLGGLSADAAMCMNAGRAVAGNAGLSKSLSTYLGRYPYQSTMILYDSFFCQLFKSADFIALKLVNTILYSLTLLLIRKFARSLFEYQSYIIDLCLVLFVPGWLMIEFGYSEVPSLFFVILGCYFYDKKKENLYFLILSGFLSGIGCALKMNSLIFIIAFIIINISHEKARCDTLVLHEKAGIVKNILSQNMWNILLFSIIVLLSYKSIQMGTLLYVKPFATEFDKWSMYGSTAKNWLYIGISDAKTGAGWWSPETYIVGKDITLELLVRVKELFGNLGESISFFLRKIANGFAMPDYEGFGSYRYKTYLHSDNLSIKEFLYNKNWCYQVVFFFMNICQSLLYIGNIFYLWLKKEKPLKEYLGIIFFIGTFLFHLLWETKGRYMFSAALFLIPTGIIGFSEFFKISEKNKKRLLICVPLAIFLCMLFQNTILTGENIEKINDLQKAAQIAFKGIFH